MTNSVVWGIHWKGLRGGDWNDLLQLLDDGSLANVSGVEYMIDAFEMPRIAGSKTPWVSAITLILRFRCLPADGSIMKNLHSQRLQSRELHLKHAQEEMPCCKNLPYLPPAPLLHP